MIYFTIIIAILIIAILIVGLVWLGTDYYVEFVKKEEEPSAPPVWQLDIGTIQLTNELGKYIDHLIEFETFAELMKAKTLEEKYDIRLIDKGIENVAGRVYSYLNKDIFKTRYLIQSEKILNYIVCRTKIFFVTSVVDHNNKTVGQ